jgi:UDP-N-acetylglucosamine acyltransferase
MQTMTDIHPTAVVEDGAQIADDVSIGPFCHIGAHVSIGQGTRLVSHVVITGHTSIGAHNMIWPNATLGGWPQDLGFDGQETQLIVGDYNVIRENVTMHVASAKADGVTRVGDHNYFMVGSHIAHDCQLASHITMANAALLAGHVHVEDGVVMGGACGIHHFTTVGRYAFIAGLTRVLHDVPPYMIVDGNPARPRQINRVGLKRNGFSADQIRCLHTACRKIYVTRRHSNNPSPFMAEKLNAVETQFPDDPHIQYLLAFLRRAMAGPHGRHLEAFR